MMHENSDNQASDRSSGAFSFPVFLLNGFVGSDHGFSGTVLKTFAIITMLIDHTGAAVVSPILTHLSKSGDLQLYRRLSQIYQVMRGLGRLAFPIFCFLIVEGFFHTRNRGKYAMRLALFALISEFPFDYALKPSPIYWQKQNVYFTLLIGLIVIWLMETCRGLNCTAGMALIAGLMFSRAMMTDYNYKGVFLIAVLYLFHSHRFYQCAGGALAIAWEKWAPLSFILCFLYNGKRGKGLKYFFYFFYPGHLMILGVIKHIALPLIFAAGH